MLNINQGPIWLSLWKKYLLKKVELELKTEVEAKGYFMFEHNYKNTFYDN